MVCYLKFHVRYDNVSEENGLFFLLRRCLMGYLEVVRMSAVGFAGEGKNNMSNYVLPTKKVSLLINEQG